MTIKLTSSTLTKQLARRTKLVHHLDSAMAKFDEPFNFEYSPKEGDDAWHPSGDCTPSVADLHAKALAYLEGEAAPEQISGSLRKTFLVGHFWHGLLQHILVEKLEFCEWKHIERRGVKGWGGQTPAEWDRVYRWHPFHWATGSADVAPCHIPKHGDFLVDFKTMNERNFKLSGMPTDRWNGGATTGEKWEAQCNIYMDWFDLERALIIGVQKDSPHDFKEFEFHRNQPLIDAIYHKWEVVSDCLDDDDYPHPSEDVELPFQGAVIS